MIFLHLFNQHHIIIIMDEKIKGILFEKLEDSLIQNDDIKKLISCFNEVDSDLLRTGIIVGRLYNSFFYQHRRILKRNPSDKEFNDLIEFIKNNLKSFS